MRYFNSEALIPQLPIREVIKHAPRKQTWVENDSFHSSLPLFQAQGILQSFSRQQKVLECSQICGDDRMLSATPALNSWAACCLPYYRGWKNNESLLVVAGMWAEFKGVGRGPNPAHAHGSTDTHALMRGSPRSCGKYEVKANTAVG